VWRSDETWLGGREVSVCFHHPDCFPLQCIGPVKIHVCPLTSSPTAVLGSVDGRRTVWLWVHFACLEEVMAALHSLLSDQSSGAAVSTNESDQICRFSLIGSLASVVLRRVVLAAPPAERLLGVSLYAPREHSEFARQVLQSEGLNSLWLDGHVLAVEAPDCRELTFSRGGEAVFRERESYRKWGHIEDNTAQSHGRARLRWPATAAQCWGLLDLSLLSRCKEDMTPTPLMHKQRSEQRQKAYALPSFFRALEKGDNWTAEDTSSGDTVRRASSGDTVRKSDINAFPVLLVRQCGSQLCEGVFPPSANPRKVAGKTDSCLPLEQTGWDIVVPSAWARPLWVALNYAGACAVGLDEMEAVHTAAGCPSFPRDFPDSEAGRLYWEAREAEQGALEQRRPRRKKRMGRRGSVPVWDDLFEGRETYTEDVSTDFAVIRNPEYLLPFVPSDMTSSTHLQRPSRLLAGSDESAPVLPTSLALSFRTMVRVSLWCTGRGSPLTGASVCRPLRSDVEQWVLHQQTRKTHTLSKGRRLGEWWGVRGCSGGGEGEAGDGREVVGAVAAGCRADLSGSPVVAVAFCEASALKELLDAGFQLSVGQVSLLVMYRNPLSSWYRPALLTVQGF
jgi:hypothetical protein